ncbi:MAG: transcriptional regulator NrdR [Actinomycetaceae bacterium]|nr:transcriptional regulator NrdR [Actinomycetaceae bacterium]
MHCPFCHTTDSRVIDSRSSEEGSAIRRRRECLSCHKRFTTLETAMLTVAKRSGVVEPFSRQKVINGVRKACQGRPVGDDDLHVLAQRVEERLRETGKSQVDTQAIGRAILPYLKELDVVAYLRFASVYSCYETLEDFQRAIDELRAENERGI